MEEEWVQTRAGRGDDAGTWAERQKGFIDVAATTLELPALRPTIFVLGSLGLVDVVWVHLLVLLPLFRRQVIPLLADGIGEISLTLLPPGPPGNLRNTRGRKG